MSDRYESSSSSVTPSKLKDSTIEASGLTAPANRRSASARRPVCQPTASPAGRAYSRRNDMYNPSFWPGSGQCEIPWSRNAAQ